MQFHILIISLLLACVNNIQCQTYDVNVFSIQKQPHIFINQSDNQVIQATYGQIIALPCVIYRQNSQDLSNIHVIWNKLFHYQRPSPLSIGKTLLKQDMRYIVSKTEGVAENRMKVFGEDQVDYTKENWQFEIRRLNYEDSGKYQCSLSLAKPVAKNITLEVRPDLTITPKDEEFRTSDKIMITCKVTLRHKSPRSKYARNKHLRQPHRPYMGWYKDTPQGHKEHINAEYNDTTQSRKHEIHTERTGLVFKSHLTIFDANPKDSGQYRCIFEHFHQATTVRVSSGEYSHKNLRSWLSSGGSTIVDHFSLLILCLVGSGSFV